ncbi:MAG: tryptophan synthase subunit alpha [Desulfobacteraceae bacterium]|nr:tryptophan synthase subunit alpha [Desulfobacteraceae bacterium]MBC2755676.1 tryptophan synthase subunit alpha [Desulfobacteraceae bacterium]
MNRLKNLFETLKKNNDRALVGFVTAGDPNIDTSLKIISAMCENGMDILELGVPFSDPSADGPVIQRSSSRALEHNVSLKTVMEMIREIRKITSIPIIIFSYYNPIMAYGIENFQPDAIEAGADGLLVVDLPLEESPELTSVWKDTDFSLINLVAPTTPKQRMAKIASASSGFLYLVSKTGVTGSDGLDTSEIASQMSILHSVTDLPVCVGFGISTTDDVAAVASMADGVVIGSAFERLIEENIDNPELVSIIGRRTAEYKAATK